VLEYGDHDGVPYLIEECVTGATLADRFRQATMTRPPRSTSCAVRPRASTTRTRTVWSTAT